MVVVVREEVANYLVGSDVEFFLQKQDDGEIVSAEGIVQGTKTEPFKFDKDNPYFATSLDNVMAEGNIPPASTPGEFWKSVEKLRAYIDSTLPEGIQTVALPSARLDFKHLMTENAQTFGCDPSLNCWTDDEVIPEPTGDNVRSAGFHIHIGYDNPNDETNRKLARAMDLFLGVPSILLEPKNERKTVGYGHSGNYRNQKHGMEYRSLSSHFSGNEKLVQWCFNNAAKAVKFVNDGNIEKIAHIGNVIQRVINTEDKEGAALLVKDFEIELLPEDEL